MKDTTVQHAVDTYVEAVARGEGDEGAVAWTDEYRELAEPLLRNLVQSQFAFMYDLGLLKEAPVQTQPCLICDRFGSTHRFETLDGPRGWLCEEHKDDPVEGFGEVQRRASVDE